MKGLLFLVPFLCAAGSFAGEKRPAAVAGQFYPAGAQELSRFVDDCLSGVPKEDHPGRPVAVLVPHAGYVYSAPTAAHSYALLQGSPVDTVVLIGTSHHFRLAKGAVYTGEAFMTPLGPVSVDQALAREVIRISPLFESNNVPHGPEHSLEVQLPFLQRTLKRFSIVPVLLGGFDETQCREAGQALAAAIRRSGRTKTTIFVISSDMSHYPPAATAGLIDGKALKTLERFDPAALRRTVAECMASSQPGLACVFCGEDALYTGLHAARALGARKSEILAYATSADSTGDRSRVVGYGAAAFFDSGSPDRMRTAPKEKPMKEFTVSEKNQKELLAIARRSIEQYVKTNKLTRVSVADPELEQPAAVFVTLTKGGELRGCIGTTEPRAPLYQAVAQLAIAAAVEDYRFKPVTPEDLPGIRLEISVLSPLERVSSAAEIQQGKHGVVVKRGVRTGLFLPQVWEHFATKDDFMNELCRQKAGLEPGAWKDPSKTELHIFTVFAFEEEK